MSSCNLFFELIRVAIGTQENLSRQLTADEWCYMLELAKKQSLVGVCFSAVQQLGADADQGYAQIGMSEETYLSWMGLAIQIQNNNVEVNRQCTHLQKVFAEKGFLTSVLKGQGLGALYGELSTFRQSGDIDLWVDADMDVSLKMARDMCGECRYDYKNAHLPLFKETETELHWRVDILMNLWLNSKLQLLWKEIREEIMGNQVLLIGTQEPVVVPTVRLNRFYILLHCYRHFFEGGIGLRQVMDYYFVLKQSIPSNDNLLDLIDRFHMRKFASGLLWVMQHVFEGDFSNVNLSNQIPLSPNEHEGRFILQKILSGGNFGHHDDQVRNIGFSHRTRYLTHILQRNAHLVWHYPQEVLWTPIWMAWHYVWKRTVGKCRTR